MILVSIKSEKNNLYFTWRSVYIMIISRSVLLRMKNSSEKLCRENRTIYENVEKYSRAEQTTDDNKAHAYCM